MSLEVLNNDKNICFFNSPIKIITIYQDYQYDQSDHDSLTSAERNYLFKTLEDFSPEVKTGRTTKLNGLGLTVKYPQPSIIGGSPFDAIRYESTSDELVYVLTPTQAACYFLTLEDEKLTQENLNLLLKKQPINIKKIEFSARTESQFIENYKKFKVTMYYNWV